MGAYYLTFLLQQPSAFKATQTGKPPGVWKTLLEVLSHVRSTNNVQNSKDSFMVAYL